MNTDNSRAIAALSESLADDIARAIANAGVYVLKLNNLLRDGIEAGASPALIVAALNVKIVNLSPDAVAQAVKTAWAGIAPATYPSSTGYNPIIAEAFAGHRLAYNAKTHAVELRVVKRTAKAKAKRTAAHVRTIVRAWNMRKIARAEKAALLAVVAPAAPATAIAA